MTDFPKAPPKYEQPNEANFREAVRQSIAECQPLRQSVEMVANAFIYMRSPDNSRWQISVDDAGALVVTAA